MQISLIIILKAAQKHQKILKWRLRTEAFTIWQIIPSLLVLP